MRYMLAVLCTYILSGITYNAMAIIVLEKNSYTDKFALVIFGLLLNLYMIKIIKSHENYQNLEQ